MIAKVRGISVSVTDYATLQRYSSVHHVPVVSYAAPQCKITALISIP
jgi:hypothetical protein